MGRTVTLAHGSGGTKTRELVELFRAKLGNVYLNALDDSALLTPDDLGVEAGSRFAFTTDSFTVAPLFFPGGDIGKLAVNGTVNDLACLGAIPRFLSLGVIIEEGFGFDDLERIVASIAQAARIAGVQIACGDTKVVGHGQADGIFINTSGIGVIAPGVEMGAARAQPGDILIVTGPLGEHAITIAIARDKLPMQADIESDCAPLTQVVQAALAAGEGGLHTVRDLTRGGLAAAVCEIAESSNTRVLLNEPAVPVSEAVRGACDLLGFDFLELANEGRMVLFTAPERAESVLSAIRATAEGSESAIIGRVLGVDEYAKYDLSLDRARPLAVMATEVGGIRAVEPPSGELLPRIC